MAIDPTLIGLLNVIDEMKLALAQAQEMLKKSAEEKEACKEYHEEKIKELEKKLDKGGS